ncbi:hypothetical protein MRX96_019210 [Rhipicephalus microplus]
MARSSRAHPRASYRDKTGPFFRMEPRAVRPIRAPYYVLGLGGHNSSALLIRRYVSLTASRGARRSIGRRQFGSAGANCLRRGSRQRGGPPDTPRGPRSGRRGRGTPRD